MTTAREYPTDRIRNIAFLGHGGSGKTALVDALCFVAGSSKRRGNPAEGQALTMHTPEEQAHRISIQLTPAYAEHLGVKLNLLDTPGYLDFAGEAVSAVRVADAAVIVVSATSGIEVGTERAWGYCEARGIPRIVFVSMMDKEHADFEAVFRAIRERLAPGVLPVEIPIGSGPDFRGIVNLFSERAHLYRPGTATGEYDEVPVPQELAEMEAGWETELQEALATTDESVLEAYLEGGHLSEEEVVRALARGMRESGLVPVFCGSASLTYGMRALLAGLVQLCPSPAEARPEEVDGEVLPARDDGPLAALVFKTAAEPHVGELSYFRVFSGSVANGAEVVNASDGQSEKLNHLSVPLGKERQEVARLHAGDIGVVAKLRHTHTNNTLCEPGRAIRLQPIAFPSADISVAIRGATRSDEDKLGEVLPRIHEEDPTFSSFFQAELHQTIARGVGELHLEVQFERMQRKYGVRVETEQPRIAYRETILATAEAQGRHKKQSGGRGQFGDCWIRLVPRARGEGYEFVNAIRGGVIPSKYLPSVDRGIQEAAERGVLAGYPMVDFSAECYDGSFHAVDSSDIAFKIAGSLAFRAAAERGRPVLLEPILEVAVTTPEEFVGEVMGDLTARRGRVLGMEPDGARTTVRALVPEGELYRYAATLRSLTHGRGHHVRSFAGYEPAPEAVVQRVQREREGAEAR